MTGFDGQAFIDRFNTVWDAHDLNGIADMFTDDVIFESSFGPHPYGDRAVGKDAAKKLAAAIFETVPDLRFREIRHVVSPELAVVESKTTGTPVGGKPYEIHIVDVLTLRDGKIAAKRSYRKARL